MVTLENTLKLAKKYHEGQVDKLGEPYINHVCAVADKVSGYVPKTVALLHDIIEDTGLELEDLRKYGYSEDIVLAVEAMTRKSGEKYFDFIARVKDNSVAKVVKLADLEHNTDVGRVSKLAELTGGVNESLLNRYKKAIKLLEN